MSTYPCSQCGTLLTPSETVCKTCGRRAEPRQLADTSYAQPLRPKKGPNIGMLIGVGVLLLVLIGGGVLLLAGGKKALTQGATSKNILAAVGTASAMQPLFADMFADNSKGWTLGAGATISDHALTLANANQNSFVNTFLPTGNPFGDFLLKVSLNIEQGDQNDYIGLSLRTDSNFNHEYHVLLSPDQKFEIGKIYVDSSNKMQEKPLVANTNSSALNPIGQQNMVAVVMKGDHLILIINNTVVESISDSDYTSGQIALYIYHGNTSNGVKASFTNVSVYPAPDQLPS